MSLRAAIVGIAMVLAVLFAAGAARAEPVRILIAAGRGDGANGEEPLRFAEDDARRVADVFTSVGGVRREHALVVPHPTPEALAAAFDRARAIALARRPEDVTLLFYFSGHGDHDAIHLGDRALALTDLAARVGAVPAALRIVIVDACRNVRVRTKGVGVEAPFAISLSGPPAATGAVWLHASADGEAAQESDDLGGAIFTHYWVDGLRGAADANGDGKVTLSESYDFAYHQTLFRSARGDGALQRPAASIAIREALPVVLTATAGASTLKLPRSADAQYVVFALGSHTVAAEAWGSPDRSVVLALSPGRYVIQRRAPGGSGALDVSLAKGESRDLSPADFRAFTPEALAQKGGEVIVHPHEVELGYGVRTSALYELGQAVRWRYAYRFGGAWAFALSAEGGLGTDATPAEDVRVTWVGGGARLEYRAHAGDLELRAGAGPAALVVAQRFDRTDAARVAVAGYPTRQSFRALGVGGELGLGARYPLGARVTLGVDVEAQLLFADAAGGPKGYAGLAGATSVGVTF